MNTWSINEEASKTFTEHEGPIIEITVRNNLKIFEGGENPKRNIAWELQNILKVLERNVQILRANVDNKPIRTSSAVEASDFQPLEYHVKWILLESRKFK